MTAQAGTGRQEEILAGDRTLAENTGGIAITQTNLFDENIERVYTENRAYYVLGYHSTNTSTDRKLRQLKVTVAREGVTVRSRTGYSAGGAKSEAASAAPSLPAALTAASLLLQAVLVIQTLLKTPATDPALARMRTFQLVTAILEQTRKLLADVVSVDPVIRRKLDLIDSMIATSDTSRITISQSSSPVCWCRRNVRRRAPSSAAR